MKSYFKMDWEKARGEKRYFKANKNENVSKKKIKRQLMET